MDWRTRFRFVFERPLRLLSSYYYLAEKLNTRINAHRPPPSGHDVVAADWDTLLLLDGCRYDLFDSVCELPGKLSPVTSRGSFSEEFITRNFAGKELHDTVYVTANPYADVLSDRTFHDVIDVLASDWDPDLGTVSPATMRDRVASCPLWLKRPVADT